MSHYGMRHHPIQSYVGNNRLRKWELIVLACISCSSKVEKQSDRFRENDRLQMNYFFLKASTSAISATTRAAMDNPSTSGEGELEAVSDAFSSFGFS